MAGKITHYVISANGRILPYSFSTYEMAIDVCNQIAKSFPTAALMVCDMQFVPNSVTNSELHRVASDSLTIIGKTFANQIADPAYFRDISRHKH